MDSPSPETSRLHDAFRALREGLSAEIVGQSALVERLLIALLADGHLLVEGAPGLAKTSAIRALAARLEADFARVQFTPDLLPADLTGTEVWRPQEGRFEFQPGPIFHPVLLADEINRAPAKVQSALLEAMGERQVTVGRHTYPLPPLFLVMATQNPIEQEGTFPLPEAQLDRFLMYVRIGYPEAETETEILRLARERARDAMQAQKPKPERMPLADVFAARQAVLDLHVAPALERYLVELVLASRLAGIAGPIDGVTVQLDDAAIAIDDAAHARALGMTGKLCIHPKQIAGVLGALAPSDAEIAWARRVLASGEGAVSVDGAMVDEPVRIRARAILEQG